MGGGETRDPAVTVIPWAASEAMRRHRVFHRTILVAEILVLLSQPTDRPGPAPRPTDSASPGAESLALILRVVRIGTAEASILGVSLTLNDTIDLLIDGVSVANTTPVWNLDYWFLHVPVSDNSTVQIRIGLVTSPVTTVPPYVPQRVGPPGFVYAEGARLMLNGSPIQFFGMNEQTSFPFALIASGLYGWDDPAQYWGRNDLFPSDRNGTIANVSSADDLWREFFRYVLYYQNVSSEPSSPRPNLLRIWIIDEGFGVDMAYAAWKANASAFWGIFDRLVYWADRAGIYLVPVLGHQGPTREHDLYDVNSTLYAHHLELVRAIVARYDDNPRIAMWDLWNEPDVNDAAYWASVGGIVGFPLPRGGQAVQPEPPPDARPRRLDALPRRPGVRMAVPRLLERHLGARGVPAPHVRHRGGSVPRGLGDRVARGVRDPALRIGGRLQPGYGPEPLRVRLLALVHRADPRGRMAGARHDAPLGQRQGTVRRLSVQRHPPRLSGGSASAGGPCARSGVHRLAGGAAQVAARHLQRVDRLRRFRDRELHLVVRGQGDLVRDDGPARLRQSGRRPRHPDRHGHGRTEGQRHRRGTRVGQGRSGGDIRPEPRGAVRPRRRYRAASPGLHFPVRAAACGRDSPVETRRHPRPHAERLLTSRPDFHTRTIASVDVRMVGSASGSFRTARTSASYPVLS